MVLNVIMAFPGVPGSTKPVNRSDIKKKLREVFKHDDFRTELQRAAVETVVQGSYYQL